MKETTLLTGKSRSLVAVLSHPHPVDPTRPPPAILLLNAGFQHHVGPHSLHVHLARKLAGLGFLAVRLDFSGLGDSPARTDNALPQESHLTEAREVMDDLAARFGCTVFASLGLCSGARESLRLALVDTRLRGALLLNPVDHLHDDTDVELTSLLRVRALRRHYLRLALHSSYRSQVWRQALRGDFDTALLRRSLRGPSSRRESGTSDASSDPSGTALQQLQSLGKRGVNVLHVYSEGDPAVDYFHVVLGPRAGDVPFVLVRGANHTFTPLWCQDQLSSVVLGWAGQVLASASPPQKAVTQ